MFVSSKSLIFILVSRKTLISQDLLRKKQSELQAQHELRECLQSQLAQSQAEEVSQALNRLCLPHLNDLLAQLKRYN
jgi:hypothetical protein